MSKNTNRDYLIIVDVKASTIKEINELEFYINDKESHNIFVQLVVKESHDIINKYVAIDDANLYELTMNIVKPTNEFKKITGELISLEDGLYEFKLPQDCCDKVGTYKCELETKYNSRITNSNKIKYRVKKSVLNNLDSIVEAPGYPIVIQLFDKLSDIEQYEEDRRANELARQLAEQQRQTRFNTLDADMVDRVNAMDSKMDDIEARISTKEQAVDKLIIDTKKDIDNYKVAKDQEIDEYKTAKDTEINNAITNQDNKIDTAINAQNDRIAVVENNDAAQNNRLDTLENRATQHESRLDVIEAKNTQQDGRLDVVENKNQQQDNRLDIVEAKNVEQDNRLATIEAIDVAQNTRLDAIEVKNQEQDDRLLDIEKVNKRQDMNLKCLFAESKNNMIDVTEEGNSIYLQNSTIGYTLIDEIKGNTLVNCNKEPDKELILNGNINTSADNTVTLTEGVDGGLVDVALEGNTLVNVSKAKDSTAISKAYTVEDSGNHIALQGDIDGSCRPVIEGNTLVNLWDKSLGYVTSGKGNFIKENNGVTVNNTSETGEFVVINASYLSLIKPNTIHTLIIDIETSNNYQIFLSADNTFKVIGEGNTSTRFVKSFTSGSNSTRFRFDSDTLGGTVKFKNITLLEGDYTDKPITDYFEGLQSSFEDNLVTQEMVDAGEELAENLGKYKVEYKVTGKNLFDCKLEFGAWNNSGNKTDGTTTIRCSDLIEIKPNTNYIFSGSFIINNYVWIKVLNKDKTEMTQFYNLNELINTPSWAKYMVFHALKENIDIDGTVQLEEGKVSTPYEPYKEYTKTFYLNSPLLEGDTIEQQGNNVVHAHRYGKVVLDNTLSYNKDSSTDANGIPYFSISRSDSKGSGVVICDKLIGRADTTEDKISGATTNLGIMIDGQRRFRCKTGATTIDELNTWLTDNPLTVIYELNSPTYEVISQNDTILCDSYVNGHLHVDSVVPIEKVDFLPFSEELTYLYANTQYTVQFISDKAIIANTTLGGTQLLAQNIVAGLNRISITTPETLVDNKLVISGVGANISEVVVTDTDREFGYFEGMKSVGECEDLEVVSSNSDGTQSNTQTLTHEPLRAVGDIKDKYVLIDGKWYIERNCTEVVLDGSDDETWATFTSMVTDDFFACYHEIDDNIVSYSFKCDTFKRVSITVNGEEGIDTYHVNNTNYVPRLRIRKSKLSSNDINGVRNYLSNNPMTIVYQLSTPTYEPIGYNPFTVYSDVTHISNNSTIPCNMTIKNTGYNCLLKPSTTYTISSNLGLNTVTTPYTLTEDCLRFYDTDTSNVTTMKDVLVLEGDYTTGKPLPSHFSGIESAFEQEYDEGKGKYKVKIRVQNEDASKENYIEFHINEPLRGIGDVKDKVYVKNDKVIVERNCGSVILDGSEQYKNVASSKKCFRMYIENYTTSISKPLTSVSDKFIAVQKYGLDQEYIYLDQNLILSINKCKLTEISIQGFKQWLQQNPTTVVYQLASPTYEEVEYNDTKLFIESFKNSTLSYNSNVPVTSKVHYSYSVPIVDTVAKTASISDEQDVMIIDLATQVAVMEMMLM